jgi:hypothetical protein
LLYLALHTMKEEKPIYVMFGHAILTYLVVTSKAFYWATQKVVVRFGSRRHSVKGPGYDATFPTASRSGCLT